MGGGAGGGGSGVCILKQEPTNRRVVGRKSKERINQGARLSEERDSRKRKLEDMSDTEQQILEDYDTRKTHKEHAKASGKKLPQFRGKMLPRPR